MADKIITRFPPSPTGAFQVGNARTALFNYFFAKQNNGSVILRFEDTDKARSTKESETDFFEGLEWLGLTLDGVYRQSERGLIYRRYIEKMVADGLAYVSDEVPKDAAAENKIQAENDEDEEGEWHDPLTGKKEIIRFKNPKKVVTFKDEVRGEISVDTTELGDFIIAKGMEEPLYHLAVVIDDFEMGVTHIIRGEDGIYNTPRQILLQEAIGAPRPTYCHAPFILGQDRKKLSKRHGTGAVRELKEKGYLSEALVNYLSLLGWNPGTDQEIFTLEELVKTFSFSGLQKAPAVFDIEKLNWFNREHLKRIPQENFAKLVKKWLPKEIQTLPEWSEDRLQRLLPELRERATVLKDLQDAGIAGEFDYFFSPITPDMPSLIPKNTSEAEVLEHLSKIEELLSAIPEENFSKEGVKDSIWTYAGEKGRGKVLWPMRYALSAKIKSPDPFIIAHVLGKTETLKRISAARGLLSSGA